jgi:hypothetical protein
MTTVSSATPEWLRDLNGRVGPLPPDSARYFNMAIKADPPTPEADTVPDSTYAVMWHARFGHEWVVIDDIKNAGVFYSDALRRLASVGQLDFVYLADRAKTACKLQTGEKT